MASGAVSYIVQSQRWIFLSVNQSPLRLDSVIYCCSALTRITVIKLVGIVFLNELQYFLR